MWTIRLAIALAVTMTVPIAGYFVSDYVTFEINASLADQGLPPFGVVCASPEADESTMLRIMCLDLATLPLLHKTSVAAGVLSAGFIGTLLICSLAIGRNRTLLASLFPIIVQSALYFIVLNVLLQGAVLTLASYVGQEYFTGKVRLYIVGGVALGALAAAYKLFEGIFDYGGKLRTQVVGVPLSEAKAPGFFEFVKSIATRLGAKMPDNIVVGLQPNFFVTSAEVVTPASTKPLGGDTLYVSASLARLMTVPEFAAVIGHELGHFRGEDTEFSLKFTPVYAGLGQALADTRYEKGERVHHGLAKIPARAMLSFIMDIFAINERAISRRRELLADQAGAEAASPRALITALAKTAFYSVLWEGLREENIDRLHRGKASRNLSDVLEGKVRYDIDDEKLTKALAEVSKRTVPHPTDSHPPIGVRMKSLGMDAGSIAADDMNVPENSAILLFRNAIPLEENLSVMEHKHLADQGLAPAAGRGTGGAGRHLSIIYRMAVAMSGTEAKPSADRIRVAETVGPELFPDFEATDFRQACSYAADIPDLETLAQDLKELIDADQRRSVIGFLKQVAGAEGEMSLGEQIYIEAVAEELGITD